MFRSVQLRMLGRMLLLLALTLGAVTAAESVLLSTRTGERIDGQIAREVSELRAFLDGHRPAADQPATGVRELFEAVLRNQVPNEHQTMLTLVDGEPFRRTAVPPPARLDTDPALVAEFAAATRPAFGDTVTRAGHVRYAVVPVSVQGDPRRGVFVIAAFTGREYAEISDAIRIEALIGLGSLLLAAGVGWVFASRLLAPLRLLRDAARSINESDLATRIPVHDNDEISELARTFNAMLDRLEQAFATQRQFIDDAGHELRTPLTIVLGHLELIDADPADRQNTIALVTDELHRMNRIVKDMLTLTHAGHPDFLHPADVDLSELVEEVYIKASALAPHHWILEVPESPRFVTVHGDRHRLTQALVQLAQNAAQHTPQHAPVRIGWRVRRGTAELWVRDSGPGVPPEEENHIFDRFARATRIRRTAGAGLGLAIVRAIAEAHHGRVVLHNRPGHGATFTLLIPLTAGRAPQHPLPSEAQ